MPNTHLTIVVGLLTVAAFLGGVAAWSVLAPLESAAMAPGFVSVESHRKTIAHLEGGIVQSILVREGERVKRGQEMVIFDSTQSSAALAFRRGRQLAFQARAARLTAEKDELEQITFPDSLASRMDQPDVRAVVDGEIGVFQSRAAALDSQISVLKQQNAQYAALITGLKNSIRSQDKQLKVLREQIDLYQSLLEKGLTQKPRVLELRGREAEVEGQKNQNEAEIARTKQRIGETDLRIADLRSERRNKAAEELRSVQTELVDLDSQILSAKDVLTRSVVVAPIDGTVVALRIFTAGGVVGPGQPIMDIVPADDRLLVDARLDPRDIDVVHPGLMAKVTLTAFQRRHVRALQGQVMSVSADRLVEERTGQAYYLVRVELTEAPGDVLGGAVLQPGMAAEVMIITGARTALQYLLDPITRSFRAAFRES